MASRFAARPTTSRSRMDRRIGRSASDYVKAYYEQNAEVEDEEEEEDPSVLPMWKSVAVAVIVIACFASIYPKLLHPFLMFLMGYGEQPTKTQVDSEALSHPSMRHPGGAGPPIHPNFGGHHMPRAADRFPSPAARMPGMGSATYNTESTGRSGTWHWLLPLYTVGVVIFLIYILGKILWKRPQVSLRHRYNLRYNSNKDRFEANFPGMDTDEDEIEEDDDDPSMFYDEDAEERNLHGHVLGGKQLQNLQGRLQETETAMQHILSQLEQLSSTADPAEVERVKKTAAATLNNLNKNGRNSDGPAEPTITQLHRSLAGEKKRKEAEHSLPPFMDTGEPSYISDLEKALSDFKRLSDNYVRDHSKTGDKEKVKPVQLATEPHGESQPEKGQSQSKEAPGTEKEKPEVEGPHEAEESAAGGFDVMESDQACVESLTVQPGDGEMIPVDSGDTSELPNNGPVIAADCCAEDENNDNGAERPKHVRRRKGRKVRKASDT